MGINGLPICSFQGENDNYLLITQELIVQITQTITHAVTQSIQQLENQQDNINRLVQRQQNTIDQLVQNQQDTINQLVQRQTANFNQLDQRQEAIHQIVLSQSAFINQLASYQTTFINELVLNQTAANNNIIQLISMIENQRASHYRSRLAASQRLITSSQRIRQIVREAYLHLSTQLRLQQIRLTQQGIEYNDNIQQNVLLLQQQIDNHSQQSFQTGENSEQFKVQEEDGYISFDSKRQH